MITNEQLDEIEKLAEGGTPGMWVAEKDAAFIAAMREYALPLVKALREARAEVERLLGLLRTVWEDACEQEAGFLDEVCDEVEAALKEGDR